MTAMRKPQRSVGAVGERQVWAGSDGYGLTQLPHVAASPLRAQIAMVAGGIDETNIESDGKHRARDHDQRDLQ